MISANDPAPDFELPADDGTRVRLADLRGKWVVLFFYPQDETPGCIAESCEFRDRHSEFADAGAIVLGVSPDSVESHRAFRENRRLPYRLLADEDKKTIEAYGAKGLLGMTRRITFIVAPDGRVAASYESRLAPRSHVEAAIAAIRGAASP